MSKLREGWGIQKRVLHALMIRDLMMRYGRDNIGFAWVIIEPMILTTGVMLIWSMMGTFKEGLRVIEVVFTGYLPLTLWRHLTNNSVNLFRNSIGLFFHRRVSLFDVFLARQLLEFIGASAALLIIYTVLTTIGLIAEIERYDLLFLGWFMMAWLGVAGAALIAALTEKYEVAERFVQPFQYLNIPLSGAFFFTDWLPTWGQHLIAYHPMVHCYEVFRAGYFGSAVVTHYDIPYFVACASVFTYLGVYLIQKTKGSLRLS